MQDSPKGDMQAIFFMHIQLIFMHFILMVLPCAPGGAGADDRACRLFGRKIDTVPVRCHVQPRV